MRQMQSQSFVHPAVVPVDQGESRKDELRAGLNPTPGDNFLNHFRGDPIQTVHRKREAKRNKLQKYSMASGQDTQYEQNGKKEQL